MKTENVQAVSLVIVMLTVCFSIAGAAEKQDTKSALPAVHHILLEVTDMHASLKFYQDVLGLKPRSLGDTFSTLEAANMGIYLSTTPWGWKAPRRSNERPGLGMYPHLEVKDVRTTVDRIKAAGYRIVQEPEKHPWGTEAFVADPDGYTWALISLPEHEK